MSSVIESLERAQLRRVPEFQAGDRVRVHFQVIEGSRRRTQVFEGVVIKRQGHGVRETFTVRKQSFGVGVERTFPVHSPKIEKIEIAARGDVRRAKLYYLRERVGKRARVRERRYVGPERAVAPGLLRDETEAVDARGVTAEESVADEGSPTDGAATAGATTPEAAAEATVTDTTADTTTTDGGESAASADAPPDAEPADASAEQAEAPAETAEAPTQPTEAAEAEAPADKSA
ncbi:hypothetical protein DSM104329_02250 [Capillimicrobium parvum]|uniref:Large ribosomal subunit protein bL19 n=1 Tax=Capillimicrobium parvum TaxID=2884022 RepID=A0A9E6XWS3_9ACTN|nr:hypothetical protein DSM104329_02250 [Capillimicrobium parvum]